MKKITLFLFATLFSALSFAALNPFAYGLSSSLDGTTLKVNYSLNADATGVSVVILDGETEVHTVTCDGKTKGNHSVDISTLGLPTGKSLTWKVNVTGAAVTKATAVSTYRFFHPSSVDIDNNPESAHFGRLLCIEASHSIKTASRDDTFLAKGFGAGIFAFNAAFEPIKNGELAGFNGGNIFTTTHYAVRRVRISDDGRIFVTAQNNGGCFLWEVDPDDLNSWTKVFEGKASTYTTTTPDGKFIAGTNSGFDVHGSGENLKLVMLSASISGANQATFRCDEYDLGTAKTWSTVPSRTIPGASYHIVTNQSNVQYDKDGGVWHIQYRGICNDANPGLVHINKDGVEDYKLLRHYTRNAGFSFNKDFTKVIVAGKFQNGTGTQKYATIYAVSKDVDGKPVLTEEQVIDMTNIGYALNDFAWDWADNIYAVDNNGEYLCAYALPHAADKVVSTPCSTKYAFEVEEVETYTITASAANNTMGYVTGGGTYYAGETVTLKAVANSTYCFVNWSDGNTDATRTFTATADVTLTANFAKAYPRAWAYDLKMVEDGDKYKFSFNATTAANATLLFLDKEGNELYTAHDMGAVAAGANTVSIEKAYFDERKDVYWAVKMDGEPITAVAEITDQTRGIYDFYNMMGVTVDNDPNSNEFGKVYVQMPLEGTTNSKVQTPGIFIFDQNLNSLNSDPNTGIAPTVPSGYTFGDNRNKFHRLNINPNTGDLVYSYSVSDLPAVFAINRKNMTGEVANLLSGVSGLSEITRTGAHCFDKEGNLYILDIYPYSNTKYPQGWNGNGIIYKIVDGVATKLVENSNWANESITLASDGRGGLWVSQYRGALDGFYQLAHVTSEGVIDWYVNKNNTHGFEGHSYRGALAYDTERHILAQGRNSTVEVFQVAYDATTGVPTLTKIATTPQVNKQHIDALAFDYAGDLYVCNSGTEKFYKYTLPTAENICTVPAPKSQAIMFTPQVTVTINVVGNGTTTGAGTYDKGSTVTLKAIAQANNRFVNWKEGETILTTETTHSLTVTEDVTLTANFEAIPQYAITVETSNADQGSVTGGGTYYEGEEVTIKATAVGGFVFEKWSDDNTDNPRTITVSEAATYTAIFKLAPARVFAYDLDVVDNGNDTYTLSFIPNTNAVSGRVILYNGDTKAQIHEESIAGAIVKGVKSEVVISRSSLPATGNVTWAVELTGEQVEQVAMLNNTADENKYRFYRPQGVAIDNNPASDFFGRIYIAYPEDNDKTTHKEGIVVLDPLHNSLKAESIKPSGVGAFNNGQYDMHRIAVNPINNKVYYTRALSETAIYEMTPDATNILTDGGTAQNVINGIGEITNANSLCFDKNGTMYVLANANYTNAEGSTGRIYKVVDGEATLVTASSREWASKSNSIVSDERGGFWVAQHRANLDAFSHLSHINADGVRDFNIDKDENVSLLPPVQTFTSGGNTNKNASYRGQVAYYSIDENNGLVAYGGAGKVSIFKVTYNGSGVPTLTVWQTISLLLITNTAAAYVDGLAFDYAGNLIVMSSSDERFMQYALPLESENTSLVPSPTSKTIKLGTLYNVEVAVNDNAMGTATGAGEYLEGETATVEATANADYRFVNWTKGTEVVSTEAAYSFTVTENIILTANFAPLPEIAYELNGGVWNEYGWTSKKDMYDAFVAEWKAYSCSSRSFCSYETQLGIGNSNQGLPTAIQDSDPILDFMTQSKWAWLGQFLDALAIAQGKTTMPTSATKQMRFGLGNFFGEDNNQIGWLGAVDCSAGQADPEAFQPTWGQTLPNPTQPTTTVVLGNPCKENYLFGGWYAESDFSGVVVTTVDENTDGTLYAKWVEHFYTRTVTDGEYGTICLPYASSNYTGAEFYEVSWLRAEGANAGLYLDEVAAGTTLEAGKPYIFRATGDLLTVYYEGDEVLNPVEGVNGLTGTFTEIKDLSYSDPSNILEGNYLIAQNKIWLCETSCILYPNRAYIKDSALPKTEQALLPGRRRVCMGTSGENVETGTEGAVTPNIEVIKRIENGQVIIIRDGVKYNAQGQRL